MFTGIVRAVGVVISLPGPSGARLGIEEQGIARGLEVGGSVAVNGACLTAVEVEGSVFFADVVPETLRRTNLGALRVGHAVNLEPALAAGGPLDGHIVQGHVDATASVRAVSEAVTGREVLFELPASIAGLVAEKGSITVDGVSLTVTSVDQPPGTFGVALIPHTLGATVLGGYTEGSRVNLEVDVVARYVARLVRPGTGADREGAE